LDKAKASYLKIHGYCIEVYPMARPIDLKLVLEEDDARIFMDGFNNPQTSKKKIEMFRMARSIYKDNQV